VAVRLPQSQNVHRYGQPRFVSQEAIYLTPSTFSAKSQTVFVKYGDGSESKSLILGSGSVL